MYSVGMEALFTIHYWDETNGWVAHQRFRKLWAAERNARDYPEPTMISDSRGRIVAGSNIVNRCPRGLR